MKCGNCKEDIREGDPRVDVDASVQFFDGNNYDRRVFMIGAACGNECAAEMLRELSFAVGLGKDG